MNIEFIEQECFNYLSEIENPVAPVSTLLARLHQYPECAGLSESELLGFLRKHPLFRVLDPVGANDDPAVAKEMSEAGIDSGPRIILESRIPTKAEMGVLIENNLDQMTDALEKALEEAVRNGRPEVQRQVQEMIDRSKELRRRFKEL